jgi:hypothetical protein
MIPFWKWALVIVVAIAVFWLAYSMIVGFPDEDPARDAVEGQDATTMP